MKEMSRQSGETEYELEKIRDKAFKLDRQLADTIIKLNNAQKMFLQQVFFQLEKVFSLTLNPICQPISNPQKKHSKR